MNTQSHAARVRADHYAHLFLLWGAGAYAWQIHGFWTGVAVVVALYAIISASNLAVLAHWGTLSALRVNRWLWVAVAWLVVALTGADIGRDSDWIMIHQ